jgi:hypothetical protein
MKSKNMKTNHLALAANLLLAVAFTLSCSSDDGEMFYGCIKGACIISAGSSGALQNSDMAFVNSAIPTGKTAYIKDVQFNGNAIAGGSSSITVTSSEQLSELYLQVEGESGYYVRQLSESDLVSSQAGNYVYSVPLQFSQQLEGGELQFTVSGATAQHAVSSGRENKVQVIKAGTGALQISLSWDKYDDLDLYVYTPSGKKVYWDNKKIAATGKAGKAELDIDSNMDCEIDGKNTENIYFESPLEAGEYAVEIHLYKKCSPDGTAGARYNVSANLNGKFISFSPNQSGKFADDEDEEYIIKIGTITIN